MKAVKTLVCAGLIFVLVFAVMLTGCGDGNQSGLTVDEPDITVEYLQGDYVKQLLRDGAEHVFGNITLSTEEDGTIKVEIDAKEFVEDAEQPSGFYIEDRNYSLSTALASDARCTFLSGGVSLPQIMTTEQFVAAYEKDLAEFGSEDFEEYQKHKMYDMYIMGDQIQLILARYIP